MTDRLRRASTASAVAVLALLAAPSTLTRERARRPSQHRFHSFGRSRLQRARHRGPSASEDAESRSARARGRLVQTGCRCHTSVRTVTRRISNGTVRSHLGIQDQQQALARAVSAELSQRCQGGGLSHGVHRQEAYLQHGRAAARDRPLGQLRQPGLVRQSGDEHRWRAP